MSRNSCAKRRAGGGGSARGKIPARKFVELQRRARSVRFERETAIAETALRDASWLYVHGVEALNLLAEMHLRQNRLADACATQQRAVARQPNLPREYFYLSRILEKMGRTAEAKEAIANVTRLQLAAQSYGALAVD